MIGDAMRHTARSRNREDVGVAVVLAREGNCASVGREDRRGFDAYADCQACGMASLAVYAPQVARVVENDLCLTQRGSLQQMRFLAWGGGHAHRIETREDQDGKTGSRQCDAQISSPYCKD